MISQENKESKPLTMQELDNLTFKKVYICDKNNVLAGIFDTILRYSYITDTLYLFNGDWLLDFSRLFDAYNWENYEILRENNPKLGPWSEDEVPEMSFQNKYLGVPYTEQEKDELEKRKRRKNGHKIELWEE